MEPKLGQCSRKSLLQGALAAPFAVAAGALQAEGAPPLPTRTLGRNGSAVSMLATEGRPCPTATSIGRLHGREDSPPPGSAMPAEEPVLSRRQPGGMFYVVAVLDSSIRDPSKL